MAHFPVVPIRSIDGRKEKNFRVLEFKSALVDYGVPGPNHAQIKNYFQNIKEGM
jgi:hypothetical protein